MSDNPGRRTVWHRVAVSAALAFVTPASAASARSVARQVEAIYQPFRVEQAALAPDGRHVAFVVREGRGIDVQIFEVDPANRVRLKHATQVRESECADVPDAEFAHPRSRGTI